MVFMLVTVPLNLTYLPYANQYSDKIMVPIYTSLSNLNKNTQWLYNIKILLFPYMLFVSMFFLKSFRDVVARIISHESEKWIVEMD